MFDDLPIANSKAGTTAESAVVPASVSFMDVLNCVEPVGR